MMRLVVVLAMLAVGLVSFNSWAVTEISPKGKDISAQKAKALKEDKKGEEKSGAVQEEILEEGEELMEADFDEGKKVIIKDDKSKSAPDVETLEDFDVDDDSAIWDYQTESEEDDKSESIK